MAMIGFLLGLLLAALPIYLLALLVGLIFKSKEPDERAIFASVGAFVVVFFVSALGFANGGPMRWSAGLLYIPATAIAFLMIRRRYRQLWNATDTDGLERTFE